MHTRYRVYIFATLIFALGLILPLAVVAASYSSKLYPVTEQQVPLQKGVFLVATQNLTHTSFQKTVILMTHVSSMGATGLTINRSANIPLKDAYPSMDELKNNSDNLFLGGPVHTDTIYVLMQTKRPHAGMRNVLEDIYYAAGIAAIIHGLPKKNDDEQTRAYAGYAGWAPGQLQAEIKRGDWLIIQAEPNIVFDGEMDSLWERLFHSWSGKWI